MRTVCTSSLATLADPAVPSPLSRPVSVDKSVAASVLVKRVSNWIWHIVEEGVILFSLLYGVSRNGIVVGEKLDPGIVSFYRWGRDEETI